MNHHTRVHIAATSVAGSISAAIFAVATIAACATEPDPGPTTLRTAIGECIEDTHASVTYQDGDTLAELRGVVPVDHPDAENRLQITEAQCVQNELGAPADNRIEHPRDIDHRAAYEWGDYRVTATHVADSDGLTLDVIFYGPPAAD